MLKGMTVDWHGRLNGIGVTLMEPIINGGLDYEPKIWTMNQKVQTVQGREIPKSKLSTDHQ